MFNLLEIDSTKVLCLHPQSFFEKVGMSLNIANWLNNTPTHTHTVYDACELIMCIQRRTDIHAQRERERGERERLGKNSDKLFNKFFRRKFRYQFR
uniref:Uncharacterized protein n=1 Tax=Octopus bimaculoides TaxID=37653 RepID=A0A0L8G3I7_OCTBM